MNEFEDDIDQDWRSVLRDEFDLNDLRSFGDEFEGFSCVILDELLPPALERVVNRTSTENGTVPSSSH